MHPSDGGFIAQFGQGVFGEFGDGFERTVVDFRTFHNGHILIEQIYHAARDAGFGLSAQSQQVDVVAGQDGFFQLWNHGVFIAHESFKNGLFGLNSGDEVVLNFFVYGFVGIARGFQFLECGFWFHG